MSTGRGPLPLDGMPIAMLLLDHGDAVVHANAVARELFDLADTVHVTFRDLPISHRIDGLRAIVERVKGTGQVEHLRGVRLARPDRTLTLDFSVRPASIDSQRRGVVIYATDVTALATLQTAVSDFRVDGLIDPDALAALNAELQTTVEELSVSNEMLHEAVERLQAADRQKDEFIAVMAHELRNPVAAAMSAQEVVARDHDPGAVDHAKVVLKRQLAHLARLIDDLLDVKCLSRGTLELRRAPVDLVDVVTEAYEAVRADIEARGITATIAPPAERPVLVVGDPTRLIQAVANLLHNAAKFNLPEGRIDVALRTVGRCAVIRVTDSGIGIERPDLGRIFEEFEQLHRGDSPSGGLGLGLALARQLVELHGGMLKGFSAGPGKGSTFLVRIPLAPSGVCAAGPAPAPVETRPRRILLVEDNDDVGEMLKRTLELDGHQVDRVGRGLEAIARATASRPDVMLIDLGLPDIDGHEVARRVRTAFGPGIRLVALTGYGQPSDRQASEAAGFDRHLVKPVDTDTLGRVIAEL